MITEARSNLELDLLACTNYVPYGTTISYNMRRAANFEPVPNLADLAKSAFDPKSLK